MAMRRLTGMNPFLHTICALARLGHPTGDDWRLPANRNCNCPADRTVEAQEDITWYENAWSERKAPGMLQHTFQFSVSGTPMVALSRCPNR